MTPAERYELDSVDPKTILESPEAFEIVDVLLNLYRSKCRTEERLEEKVQALLDRIYGRKSEKSKYHPDQKLLLPELLEKLSEGAFDAAEPTTEESSDSKPETAEKGDGKKQERRGGHGRSKLPAHIERRVVERIDVDEPTCDSCDAERPVIRVETSERLNYIPATAVVDVTETVIRGPLPCDCDQSAARIIRPELPSRPIDGGMPGVELLVAIVIGKFFYHLPHYRQVTKTLKDSGINLSKQTVWDWTRGTAELLEPLWELMRERLLAENVLAADETADGRSPPAGQPNQNDLPVAISGPRRRRGAVHGVRLRADACAYGAAGVLIRGELQP